MAKEEEEDAEEDWAEEVEMAEDWAEEDISGSVSNGGEFKHTCLPDALNALGYDVHVDCDGPFQIYKDGNQMLAKHGRFASFGLCGDKEGC